MVTGFIKEIETVEGQIIAIVSFGNGDEKTCITYGIAGGLSYPQVGDQCLVSNIGNEWIIEAVFTNDESLLNGEVILFGRDTDGARVSVIHLGNDGAVKISNNEGFIELKADGQANINDNFTVDV